MFESITGQFFFPTLSARQIKYVVTYLQDCSQLVSHYAFDERNNSMLTLSKLCESLYSILFLAEAAEFLLITTIQEHCLAYFPLLLREILQKARNSIVDRKESRLLQYISEFLFTEYAAGSLMNKIVQLIRDAALDFPCIILPYLFQSVSKFPSAPELLVELVSSDRLCLPSEDNLYDLIFSCKVFINDAYEKRQSSTHFLDTLGKCIRLPLLTKASLQQLFLSPIISNDFRCLVENVLRDLPVCEGPGFLNCLVNRIPVGFPSLLFKPRADRPIAVVVTIDSSIMQGEFIIICPTSGAARRLTLSPADMLYLVPSEEAAIGEIFLHMVSSACDIRSCGGANSSSVFIFFFLPRSATVSGFCVCLASLQAIRIPRLYLPPPLIHQPVGIIAPVCSIILYCPPEDLPYIYSIVQIGHELRLFLYHLELAIDNLLTWRLTMDAHLLELPARAVCRFYFQSMATHFACKKGWIYAGYMLQAPGLHSAFSLGLLRFCLSTKEGDRPMVILEHLPLGGFDPRSTSLLAINVPVGLNNNGELSA
ncbi:unnamed protein product [Protopolystoma xenopodis]|uniref:Uncharacterized protein n=1 Tax=Protopolystoma xenopodis TaxID=117903 RepID=A0A3S5AJG1_9PLAT|nr:unnamed protein product [Protopolystoma xenopodis]